MHSRIPQPIRKTSAVERDAALQRAQLLTERVARLHAQGDHFAPERFRLLRLLTIAMGTQRDQAGALLSDALGGDSNAEERVQRELAGLILQT